MHFNSNSWSLGGGIRTICSILRFLKDDVMTLSVVGSLAKIRIRIGTSTMVTTQEDIGECHDFILQVDVALSYQVVYELITIYRHLQSRVNIIQTKCRKLSSNIFSMNESWIHHLT